MSNICVINKKIEVEVVKVPDYTEAIAQVKKVQEENKRLVELTQKNIEIQGDSILEQIATYVAELYKPVLNRQVAIPFRIDSLFASCNIHTIYNPYEEERVLDAYGKPRYIYDSIEIRGVYGDSYASIIIAPDKRYISYKYKSEKDREYVLSALSNQWSRMKDKLISYLHDYYTSSIQLEADNMTAHNERVEAIMNFSL